MCLTFPAAGGHQGIHLDSHTNTYCKITVPAYAKAQHVKLIFNSFLLTTTDYTSIFAYFSPCNTNHV